ncbi:CHASE domain-containing protein [Marinobacter fonticola]|uniref:CHASE domain-containing protein n=1 Tax=Marinobacter fonticola TaxID=2603215 RepID=UPI0011E632F7|nr:CHASE domain-containing protein [Marinobacter fonticola]
MTMPEGRSLHIWLPGLVLIIGLLCTVAVNHQIDKGLSTLRTALLESHHQHFTDTVQQALTSRVFALDLIAGSLGAGDRSANIFERQSENLLRRLPDVLNLDRIVRVTDAQRETMEQRLSRENGQNITFGEWQSSGNTRPAGQQAEYQVVSQVAGRDSSKISLGLVAPSVPHWRQPMDSALQHNKVSATAQTQIQRNGRSQSAVRLFRAVENGAPAGARTLISLAFSPDMLLQEALPNRINPRLQVTVFDLDQHLKTPLFATDPVNQPQRPQALRSAIGLADREWILTTLPDAGFADGIRQHIQQVVWLVGLLTTLAAALIALWLCRRVTVARAEQSRLGTALQTEEQRLENARIEKTALKQALQDSEQRSRDLVAIAGGCIAELDEEGCIGFISAQTVELLGRAPADLHRLPITDLVPDDDKSRFDQGLTASRQERQVIRLDLHMLNSGGEAVPVTVRVKPVVDTLTGCAGFRLSLHARPGMPEEPSGPPSSVT